MDKKMADHLIRSINAMGDVMNATQTNLNAANRQFTGTASDASSDIPEDQGLEIFGEISSIQQFFRGFYEAQARQTSAHNTCAYFLESQTIPSLKMIKMEITNKLKEASEEWAVLDEELRADQKKFVQLTGALASLTRWQRDLALKMRNGEIKFEDDSYLNIGKKEELSETESKSSSSVNKANGEGANGNAGFISFMSGYFSPPPNNSANQKKNNVKDDEVTMHDILAQTPPQSPVNGTSAATPAVDSNNADKELKTSSFLPPFPVVAPGAANNVGPGDPWLYNMVIKHHIARCVAKQRATRAQLLDQQQTMAVFEQTVISLVQNAVIGFLEFRQRQLSTELNVSTIPLFKHIQSLRGPNEWALFRNEHMDLLIDESAPFVEAKHMMYEGMDHPLAEIVREGPLDRLHKIATFRKPEWKEEYYVLTASGYLHGFPHHPIIAVNVTAGAFVGDAAIEHEKSLVDEPAQMDQKDEDILATTARSFASNFNLRRKSTKKRGTMFYDPKTAKFKPQESISSVIEEEQSSDFSVVGTDEVKDVTAELVKEQVNSLMNQLSDGALDRGEPVVCLYLPDCEISALGLPLDGKSVAGFGPLEFEILSKPRGRVFPRFNEKHRFKAYSQDQADFWWELISTMTKRNGLEGLETVINSTAGTSHSHLLTPQDSPKSINAGYGQQQIFEPESYMEPPVSSGTRSRRPSFPNGIVPQPDSPQSPRFKTNGAESESYGMTSTSIYNWASATVKETEQTKSVQSLESSSLSKFSSLGRGSSSASKRSGAIVNGNFNVLEQASPSPTKSYGRETPLSEVEKIAEQSDDADTDGDDSDQDIIQFRRQSIRYGHGMMSPPPKPTSRLQTGWSPRERRNSNASNASTVSAESLHNTPTATEPISITTLDDLDINGHDVSNSSTKANSLNYSGYSSPSPNLPSTPTISSLNHLAPTPPSTPITLMSVNNSLTNLNASMNTGSSTSGSVDLMQAVLKAQASRAMTDTPTTTNPSTPIGTPSFSYTPEESYFKSQAQGSTGAQSPSSLSAIPAVTITTEEANESSSYKSSKTVESGKISPNGATKNTATTKSELSYEFSETESQGPISPQPRLSGNFSSNVDVLAAVAERLQKEKPSEINTNGNSGSSVSWGGVYDPSSDQSDDEEDALNAFKAKFAVSSTSPPPPQVYTVPPTPTDGASSDGFSGSGVGRIPEVIEEEDEEDSDSGSDLFVLPPQPVQENTYDSLLESLDNSLASIKPSGMTSPLGERGEKKREHKDKEKKKERKEKKEKKRDSALETPEERERRERKRRERKEREANGEDDEAKRERRERKEKEKEKKKDEKKEEKRRERKLSMSAEDREKRRLRAASRAPEARKAP
ncbi:hypothetical protein HK098_006029 [Nowakowskiella sp. JEL0407]|nr:hypothetical protein HK098_006029 [Nowakowskiella sp. JEL0407]